MKRNKMAEKTKSEGRTAQAQNIIKVRKHRNRGNKVSPYDDHIVCKVHMCG